MHEWEETQAIRPPNPADELWKSKASCIGLDTDLFFIEHGGTVSPLVIKMCKSCEVFTECHNYALKYSMEGIWAGTNLKQKRYLKNHPPQG